MNSGEVKVTHTNLTWVNIKCTSISKAHFLAINIFLSFNSTLLIYLHMCLSDPIIWRHNTCCTRSIVWCWGGDHPRKKSSGRNWTWKKKIDGKEKAVTVEERMDPGGGGRRLVRYCGLLPPPPPPQLSRAPPGSCSNHLPPHTHAHTPRHTHSRPTTESNWVFTQDSHAASWTWVFTISWYRFVCVRKYVYN